MRACNHIEEWWTCVKLSHCSLLSILLLISWNWYKYHLCTIMRADKSSIAWPSYWPWSGSIQAWLTCISVGPNYCKSCMVSIAKESSRVIDCHYISCTRPINSIKCISSISKNMLLDTLKLHKHDMHDSIRDQGTGHGCQTLQIMWFHHCLGAKYCISCMMSYCHLIARVSPPWKIFQETLLEQKFFIGA